MDRRAAKDVRDVNQDQAQLPPPVPRRFAFGAVAMVSVASVHADESVIPAAHAASVVTH
ncbi:hypothetical protein ACFSC3_09585 [Sphingomonas floccifaciens]|uniref:Uncharacterized protein n=1 Tax=Sphingomonas floccifaciens TaxID=1844115 RepID=A0ABW4NCQ9_9SPHN